MHTAFSGNSGRYAGRFRYRINSNIVTFFYNAKYCIRWVDVTNFTGDRPCAKRYEPRLVLGVSGDQVEDLSIAYRPGVATPAPGPKRKSTASQKIAPLIARFQFDLLAQLSIWIIPARMKACANAWVYPPSTKQTMTPRPLPVESAPLWGTRRTWNFARLKAT